MPMSTVLVISLGVGFHIRQICGRDSRGRRASYARARSGDAGGQALPQLAAGEGMEGKGRATCIFLFVSHTLSSYFLCDTFFPFPFQDLPGIPSELRFRNVVEDEAGWLFFFVKVTGLSPT